MSSFDVGQGGVNSAPGGCGVPDLAVTEFWTWWLRSSGPGSCGVPEWVWTDGPGSCGVTEWVRTDGPGFSLCAVPLESSGPGFCGVEQRSGERAEVWRYTGLEMMERTLRVKGRDKVVKLIGDKVANELELRGLT